MKTADILKLALSALKMNKLRTVLTVLIISFGIMALIIIFTCIEAIRTSITENFIDLGVGVFTIQKNQGIRNRSNKKQNKDRITFKEALQFVNRYSVPSTKSIYTNALRDVIVRSKFEESNPNVRIESGDMNYIDVAGKKVMLGRGFSEIEVRNAQKVAILGYDLAVKLYPSIDSILSSIIWIEGKRFKVIGLLESKGASAGKNDNFALIPVYTAKQEFDLSKRSYELIVEAKNPNDLDKSIAEANGTMRNVRKLGALEDDNFQIVRSDKLANTYIDNISFIEMATAVIGFLTLIGAGVGLMNIMLVSVNERTREIGVSKSLGATSNVIFYQFLLEAILICIIGGILGILIGIFLGNLISIFVLQAPFTFALKWVLGGLLFCTIIGILAGILPALRASRLNPVEALRYE